MVARERVTLEMADCFVDVLAMRDVFHVDSRSSAVRATSVASPVIDQVGGRSVKVPLITLVSSLVHFPKWGMLQLST